MARVVPRLILLAVNVGGNNPIQISPSYDEAQGDAPFVDSCSFEVSKSAAEVLNSQKSTFMHTFDVVARPGNGIGDSWVYAHGAEKDPSIPCPRRIASQEHGKAHHSEKRDPDVAEAPLACTIRDESDEDGEDGGGGVRGHTEQLRTDGTIAYSGIPIPD